jgi:hypothetical protein
MLRGFINGFKYALPKAKLCTSTVKSFNLLLRPRKQMRQNATLAGTATAFYWDGVHEA